MSDLQLALAAHCRATLLPMYVSLPVWAWPGRQGLTVTTAMNKHGVPLSSRWHRKVSEAVSGCCALWTSSGHAPMHLVGALPFTLLTLNKVCVLRSTTKGRLDCLLRSGPHSSKVMVAAICGCWVLFSTWSAVQHVLSVMTCALFVLLLPASFRAAS